MTFLESIETCLDRYADFSGRASRSEFWWFALFHVIATNGSRVLPTAVEYIGITGPVYVLAKWLPVFIGLALFLPVIAVSVRRLHDIGRSGYWMLIMIFPPATVVLFIFCLLPTKKEPNKYGPYVPSDV